MKVYHERKSYATRTDEPPEKQAYGMGNGDWGLGIGDWGLGMGTGNGDWGTGGIGKCFRRQGKGQAHNSHSPTGASVV